MSSVSQSTSIERAQELAQKRVNDFERRYGKDALCLAYHAALPVALNAELVHLLRINFFKSQSKESLQTAEFQLLLSPLCREIDEGLYEIEPKIRDILLLGLHSIDRGERLRKVATFLWQYLELKSPWNNREELERAQQLTALNFLDPAKAEAWLAKLGNESGEKYLDKRDWYVAMRKEIEHILAKRVEQLIDNELTSTEFSSFCQSEYPEVYKQFQTVQNKVENIQLLIDHAKNQREILKLLNAVEQITRNSYLLKSSRFKYSYYISYSDYGSSYSNNLSYQVAKKLQLDLETELHMYFEEGEGAVYLAEYEPDKENILDSEALKQSMKLICIWTPTYFSDDNLVHAWEYRTMELREEIMKVDLDLINPMILRAKSHIPDAFKQRKCVDIQGFDMKNSELIYLDHYGAICSRLVEDAYDLSLNLNAKYDALRCPYPVIDELEKWVKLNSLS
jgi:hypothetical protein